MAARTIRTFVAVSISDEARSEIAAMVGLLGAESRAVRWVPQDNLHLTLNFIGDTDLSNRTALQQAVSNGVRGFSPFDFVISDKGCFPNWRQPRVLWLGIVDKELKLAALQRRIEDKLLDRGVAREARGFRPHLTLARVRQGERVDSLLAEFKAVKLGEFRVTVQHVDLMQSELRQDGAHYSVLHRATLADPYSETVHPS